MPGIATAATSALGAVTNGVNSSSATASAEATINNNAQQQLEIAQAQSNASLLQALGEAMKSGASSIQKAAQAS
ncbi:hypothetical protein PPGU19_060320 (plasmid) [Paraburkholderia sp. PGU19]|jgi:hypothetical protein|uniref:Uncharacterized protein n=4 Tax=Paraburkholderia TaxID=1822464 RepID=A0A7Z7FEN8_9BURK|nr:MULTISPECIES: hypothetical protein [Paraburkholderia]BEU26789.1 hypothetical protein PBP221_69290 [Paraburkholderia sp. 22B1P]GJH31917.1 hypothetical protein CBA19CS91_04190 [Paraburkholderia hospita]AUT65194.1 hypothetical protein C2L65_37155 [Paraburkholderia terrae]MDW3656733.1 hypothetical protein [Paraburkholderia terrae]TCG09937.1 hypothetical protein BZM27_02375 [Paraburkholderia steynii]